MTYETHKETRKGFTIRIVADDCIDNPLLQDDGLPDAITFLRSYDFTTYTGETPKTPESFLEEAKERGYFVRPLYAYIHSGIAFSLSRGGQFSDRFDSGFAGFIYWTPQARECVGLTDSYIDSILQEGETRESWLENSLESAVESLNDYAAGNVWGYRVEDKSGETLESCFGYLGDYDGEDGPLTDARACADSLAAQESKTKKETLSYIQADYTNLLEAKNKDGDTIAAPILRAVTEKLSRLKEEERLLILRLAELNGEEESD